MTWTLYLWESQESYDKGDECFWSPASSKSRGEHYPPHVGEYVSYCSDDDEHEQFTIYEFRIVKIVHDYCGGNIDIEAVITDKQID